MRVCAKCREPITFGANKQVRYPSRFKSIAAARRSGAVLTIHEWCAWPFKYVRQERTPRVLCHIDHGAEGKVLLRGLEGILIWRSGSVGWIAIATYKYSGAHLEWWRRGELPRTIASGGRLSYARLLEHRDRLEELTGIDPVHIITKRTLVVEDGS